MKESEITLWKILIPYKLGDGTRATKKHHETWEKNVLTNGVLTILKPSNKIWSSLGMEMSKRVIPVNVSCKEGSIENIIKYTKKHYKISRIMYYKISDCVRFSI